MTREQFVSFSLPYNLKVYDTVGETIETIEFSKGCPKCVCEVIGKKKYVGKCVNVFQAAYDSKLKLITRSLDDLVKPITHNGETFVPLVKLFEYLDTRHFDKTNKCKILFNEENIISCKKAEYKYFEHTDYVLEYYVEYADETHIKSFTYDSSLNRFLLRDETEKRPLGVAYQLDLFQKLIEWHFCLVDNCENECVFVTEEFNPYK
jgi:hypothetical protein